MEQEAQQNIWIKLLSKMPSLMFGLFLFGLAIDLGLYSTLGMSPWDVFHMGISNHSMFTLGQVSIMTGFVIIALSVFIGVIPGLGSVMNMIFIGVFIDMINSWGILGTPHSMAGKIVMLLVAVIIMGFASFFYMRVELGAGPRDGLMEGLVIKLDKPVWMIRGAIEVTVLAIGFVMGGPVGIGTVLFAFAIGPSVQFAFKVGGYDSKETHHMNFIELYKNIKDVESVKTDSIK